VNHTINRGEKVEDKLVKRNFSLNDLILDTVCGKDKHRKLLAYNGRIFEQVFKLEVVLSREGHQLLV
jgi:hypothetical protein